MARRHRKEPPVKSRKERLADALDMPRDVVSGSTKMTAYNDNRLIIENYCGILEYSDQCIRIKTSRGILCVCGARLALCAITDCDILVEGKFNTVRWE